MAQFENVPEESLADKMKGGATGASVSLVDEKTKMWMWIVIGGVFIIGATFVVISMLNRKK